MLPNTLHLFIKAIALPVMILMFCTASAQCPDNIGFENGTFQNWDLFEGFVSKLDGSISTSPTVGSTRFEMLQNTYPQALDPYGLFPINCPNGSKYSIKLGNNTTGGHAQTVSYTFTIPKDQDNYSIIYNYAVVLQNPSHQAWQQPGFTSKVFDVSANQYIDCGAFNFVASSNLPGFQLSTLSSSVYFKPWSPITIKLVGYAGKMIRLEFTSHDCAPSGHFGYAYLDVNENCTSPVSGNVYCNGSNSVTLTAPFGFSDYTWYNADYSKILGSANTLKLSPPPAPGTLFHVVVSPYPGLGCLDTLNTAIQLSPDAFNFQTVDMINGCSSDIIDLTADFVTAGSTPGLTYSYFTDPSQLNYVATPKQISSAGAYYIKAVNKAGCTDIRPVDVVFASSMKLVVKDPPAVCVPNTVDITNPSITFGSDANIVYTYWKDALATISVSNPHTIDVSGTYYIKGKNSFGCMTILPVNINIASIPVLTLKDQVACGAIDLTVPSVATSNQAGTSFTYWQDAAATIGVAKPNAITDTKTYYVKGTNLTGCSVVSALQATIFPLPYFTVVQPPVVELPATIDLTNAVKSSTNVASVFTYWQDAATTISVAKPKAIALSGMYFIKSTSTDGCITEDSVKVVVNEPSIHPPNIFSPNNDGVNDTWEIPILNFYPQCTVDIFDRTGQNIFHSIGYPTAWDGKRNGKPLPIGIYYYVIKANNKHAAISGSVTIIE
jgi:gliding motility-associated-like protein